MWPGGVSYDCACGVISQWGTIKWLPDPLLQAGIILKWSEMCWKGRKTQYKKIDANLYSIPSKFGLWIFCNHLADELISKLSMNIIKVDFRPMIGRNLWNTYLILKSLIFKCVCRYIRGILRDLRAAAFALVEFQNGHWGRHHYKVFRVSKLIQILLYDTCTYIEYTIPTVKIRCSCNCLFFPTYIVYILFITWIRSGIIKFRGNIHFWNCNTGISPIIQAVYGLWYADAARPRAFSYFTSWANDLSYSFLTKKLFILCMTCP